MDIKLRNVKVSELAEGYKDRGDEGVCGLGGRLDIRPAYQREFVYDDEKRNAVIGTVCQGFPLNTMYWAVAGDDAYEVMDGQQRTISICQYVTGEFPVEMDGSPRFFDNLSPERKQQIRDYELSVYLCDGTEDEKLKWFEIINIAGLKLEPQELRNAIYTGPWLAHAKTWFSKRNAPAIALAGHLLNGKPNRQAFLETALDWMSKGRIKDYMAAHQHDANANPLWTYFKNVIDWVNLTFPNYRSPMKGVAWGPLYDKFGDEPVDTDALEVEVTRLMRDDDVTKKSGIYDYVLSGDERALSIRAFNENMKREAFERQGGVCPRCPPERGAWTLAEMDADHIMPWSKNGRTVATNCQMLCKSHNREKSAS